MSVIDRWEKFLDGKGGMGKWYITNLLPYGCGFAKKAAPNLYLRAVSVYFILSFYIQLGIMLFK